MKKKPIFTILITFIIIIIAYFVFWNITTSKTKNVIEQEIKEAEIIYKDVGVSGFPFSKNIKISGLEFKNNKIQLTQDVVKIEQATLSSFILSNNYIVSFSDIKYYDASKKEDTEIKFNSEPTSKISFHKNGNLKSFTYKDTGYKVVNSKNVELSSAGNSSIEIYSTIAKNSIDYSVQIDFNDIQNFQILNEQLQKNIKTTSIPDKYDFNLDMSLYTKKENTEVVENSFKITELSLKNKTKNIQIALNGEMENDKEDPILSGKLKIQITNFDKLTSILLENLIKIQKQTSKGNPIDDANAIKIFSNNIKSIKNLAKKNKESSNKKAVFLVEREKKATDYKINNVDLMAFLDQQAKQAQQIYKANEEERLAVEKVRLQKETQQKQSVVKSEDKTKTTITDEIKTKTETKVEEKVEEKK